MVGYSLGITNTDPIKYGLPFERFLNPDRTTVPDYDLDFCDERRDEVVTYIQSKYGADRVAQISSDQNKPLLSRLVIADRPLAELASLYTDPDSGFPTIDITLRHIADAGLVQFNAINQIALTLIQRAVQDLAKTGTIIDIDKIGLDDERTFHLLSAGELSNIPILDDEHYKTTLIAVRPDNFKDLCAVIALCQPRLRGSIPMYVERKRSHPSTHCFHSALKSITQETYGLILYQEQVMHIAHKIAGFSMAQGDLFRRSLRKTDHKAVGVYKNKFIQGALNFGMSRSEASGMFEYVATSGQNSFNKSHAVAYAMLAYQTAWLKANFHYD